MDTEQVMQKNIQQEENKYNKERMIQLYKDFRAKKIDANSLDDKELEILAKLIREEVNILQKKLEIEIAETKMIESQVRYYENRIKKNKK